MELEDFLSKLEGVKQQPSGFSARCPAHEDKVASLSVNVGKEGGIVLKCHAGCQAADVVGAVGLTLKDLMGAPHITDIYVYTDDDGSELWRVERWANPKDFRCRPGLPPPAQRKLYRAEALAWARERNEVVYIPEGEKDANRLAEMGFVSTTNVGGAGAWLPHYAQQVKGCHVVVIADNDGPGRKHAREAAANCATEALSVSIVVPRYGKDLSELLDLGWTMDALDPLPEEEELGVLLAANVRPRPVEWVWKGYIPAGAVSMAEGDPGDGKSITTTDLAARWSSGAPMPDGSRHDGPYGVVMVSAEDDPETTIVPRLRAAGADLNRVLLVTHGIGDPSKPFTISTDMTALTKLVIKNNIKVITLDPLMAFVGDETDSHNDHKVRRALHPLYRLAQDTGAAVVVVRHLNKGTGGKAVYRGGGSIAFIGAARAAYAIGRDPEDAERRVFACVKMNIAERPPSLAFSIDNSEHGPVLKWHGAIDADAQDVMDGRRKNGEDAEILQFLNTVVESEPLTWKEITQCGADLGYSERMLRFRRDRSRLMQISGTEGRRSVRWGYLNHVKPRVPIDAPSTTHMPHLPISGVCPDSANGGHVPEETPLQTTVDGAYGWQMGTSWQMADDLQPIDDDARRDAELADLPLVCQVCETETSVHRFGNPYWVVRCRSHSPRRMGGG